MRAKSSTEARGPRAKGNEGTAEAVKNTEGAISYNEWSYAMKQHLDAAGIQTAGGVAHIGNDFVGKTISNVTIKGQGADPNDLVLDLSKVYATTTPGVYPILLASYELVCAKYPDAEVGKAVKAFMQSTVTDGQQGLTHAGIHPIAVRLPDQGRRRRQQHRLTSGSAAAGLDHR